MSSVPTLAPHSLAGELGLSVHSLPGTRKVSGSRSRTLILQKRVWKRDKQEVGKSTGCQRWSHRDGSHAKATHGG